MKIGIISESPTLTTGFGITCKQIATHLCQKNVVACFGIGEFGETFDRKKYDYNIWTVGDDYSNLIVALSKFLKVEMPKTVIINFDAITAVKWFKICKSLNYQGDIIGHIVIDGFPLHNSVIEVLAEFNKIIVPTSASLDYLNKQKLNNVEFAPHGVDTKIFNTLYNKKKLKEECNLHNDFIIGVFAKNVDRKQIPKVIHSLSILIHDYSLRDIKLYIHAASKNNKHGGHDLNFIANYFNVADFVIFPNKNFNPNKGIEQNEDDNQSHLIPSSFSYSDRIGLCDVIVNIPYFGGFELINIEAQACGIPIISIDDNGNIKDVLRESALLLKPSANSFSPTSAIANFIDEKILAEKINFMKNNPIYFNNFVQMGLSNVKRFDWKILFEKLDIILNSNK